MLKKLMAVIAGVLAFASAHAQVALPVYDGFDYVAGGNLAGNGSWASATTTIKINAANLGYSGLQTSTGNDVSLIPSSSAGRTYLNFASQTSGTVYFSFLLKVDTAPSGTRLVAYAYSTSSSSSTPYLGVFVTSGGQLAVGISTSSPQFTSSGLTVGATCLVVVAYTFGATDSAQIWINPASLGGSAPAVTGSFTSGTHNSSLAYFHFNTPSAGTGGGSYEMDELRVGSSWATVTPTGSPVVNTPPVANADTFSRAKGLSLKIPTASLLTNDTDVDSSVLSVTGINLLTTNGVILTTNGAYIFYVNSQNVDDSFTYTISDGLAYATGTVFITTALNSTGQPYNAAFTGSTASATLGGIPGYQYEVQRSTNLAAWSVLLTTNAPTAGMFRHLDNFSDLGGVPSQAYYRLRWLVPGSPPSIVAQPQSQTVTQGQTAAFAVSASGEAPLSYQWFFNGGVKTGATNSTFTLNNVQSTNAGNYFVIVTNGIGAVTSAMATLTVNTPVAPSITAQPTNQTVTNGLNATFTVTANGTAPLSYQWFFNNAAQAGATNSSLTLTSVTTNQAGNYFVRVTNVAGAVTSTVATLTVTVVAPSAPSITTQPTNQTATTGNNVTFSVVAAGTAPLSYQWFFNNAVQSGANNTSLTLTSVATNQAGNYFVRITNSTGAVTSSVVTLTVNPAPTGGVYYVATTGSDANPGTLAAPFATLAKALSVMASGNTIYMRGGNYNFTAQVKPNLAGTAANYCKLWAYPGERPVLDFSGTPAGTKALYLSKDYWHVKGLEIAFATDNGIIVAGASSNIVEGCIVRDCNNDGIRLGSSSLTASYTLILNCDSYRNFQPSSGGNNGDGFASKVGTGPGNVFRGCRAWHNSDDGWDFYDNDVAITLENCITYANGLNLWGVSGFSGNGNGFKLGGAGTLAQHTLKNCLAIQNVHDGFDQNYNRGGVTIYNCTAYGNGVNYQFPDTATVGVDVFKNNVAFSGAMNINAAAQLTSNSWQGYTVTAADFQDLTVATVTNARNADYSLPELPLLRLAAGSQLIDKGVDVGLPFNGSAPDLGAYETSGAGAPTAPAITTQPANQTVTAGGTATFSAVASGTAPLSYQWFFNTNTALASSTNASLTLTNAQTTHAGTYSVRVTNSVGSVTSAIATLTVNVASTAPSISTQPTNQTVTNGQTATFTVAASGTDPLSYQWFFNTAAQAGATNPSLVLAGVTTNQAGNYSVRVTNSVGAVTSSVVTLTVIVAPTAPAITTQPASQSVSPGSNATFTVVANGTAPLSYQWFFNTAAQSGATNAALNLVSVTTNQAGNYSVRVTNSVGAVTSAVAVLTVMTAPSDGDFYVATNGSDSNPGTLAAPFATLPKAISNAVAGKTIYVRGGTHFYSSTIRIEKSGTSNAPIRLFAYPGEQPVLNFTNQPYGSANRGILITTNGNWWEFKGLEICYAGDNGIKVEGSRHRFEQCVFHHNGDTGLQIGFGHTDANPGGLLAAFIEVINCDSYLNYDPDSKGGDADGFAAKMHCGQGIVFSGCRAWKNSDDGWDLFETDHSIVISNCWTWASGIASNYVVVGGSFAGNGNGFKLGGNGTGGDSKGTHYAYQCVTFGNKVNGFTQNSHKDGEVIFNCLSFSNGTSGYNYFFEGGVNSGKSNVFKNNSSIPRTGVNGGGFIYDGVVTEQNNTWNLAVTANAADYGNLTEAAATAPRQADGSLPTGFARLVAGSDLLDKGVDVGFPFNGSAPDLGPYEYSP